MSTSRLSLGETRQRTQHLTSFHLLHRRFVTLLGAVF